MVDMAQVQAFLALAEEQPKTWPGKKPTTCRPSYPAALGDAIMPRFTLSGQPIRRTQPVTSFEDATALIARGLIVHTTMTASAYSTAMTSFWSRSATGRRCRSG